MRSTTSIFSSETLFRRLEYTVTLPTTGLKTLDDLFAKYSTQTCLILSDGRKRTYRDVALRAEQQAKRLKELGVQPGQRVGLLLPHGEDHLTLYLACAMGGLVACPLDASLPEARAAKVREQLGVQFVCTAANKEQWSALPDKSTLLGLPPDNGDFLIILSSGTTNSPKGIVHTLRSIVESARSFSALVKHDSSTVVYHHFPMHYMAGVFNLWFCPLVSGSAVAVGERFEPNSIYTFWDLPRKLGVNHLTITPTIAHALAQLFRGDDDLLDALKRYQGIVSTSSTLYDSIAKRFNDTFGVPLTGCYGVTEVGGSITLQSWEQAISRESTGYFRSEVSIKAGDPSTPGPVLVKTPFMMRGYLNQKSPFDADGFFDTGDLGYLKDGALFVTGRSNDLIKKGGEFISLASIEEAAMRQSNLSNAAAVAVPDEFWGNKTVLFYVTKPNADHDEVRRALEDDLRSSLRKIEMPDKLIAIPKMPTTSIGKALKKDLVDLYTI